VLFLAVTMYGAMVMSGVVEEKTSRVVEVLLARMPARNLLAGKIAGIGLLGLIQIGITAVVALITVAAVGSFDIPAVRGAVIAWAVVWFVVGYALYATVFGALGSLASRTEDTQSVAGPVSGLLIAAYFVSFATVGSPHALWARLLSYVPAFSPFAMPNRVAMGGAAWWEPPVALAISVAAIAALVALGGRVYTAAILHTGPTLSLRDAWRRTTTSSTSTTAAAPHQTEPTAHAVRSAQLKRNELLRGGALVAAAVAVIAGIFAATNDFIIGLTIGAVFYTIAFRIGRARHAHQ
jgi:ABC-2 type transport system permease protein